MGYFGGGGGGSGGIITTTTTFNDDVQAQWGTSSDAAIEYDTAQTPDSWVFGVSADSRAAIIAEKADINFDFAHAQQTNPTLFIHSAAQATDQWIGFTHSGLNGIISVGLGRIGFLSGTLFVTGGTNIFANNAYIMFGDVGDQHFLRYGTEQTPDTLVLALGTVSRNLLVIERGDEAFDFAVPVQTNPTIVVASANQSTQERLGIRHNQTQGQIVDLATTAASARPIGLMGGSAVASAATITPTGNTFHVTGTTNIDNVTIMASGTIITLIFDGILTVGDAGNLKLVAAFVTTADDTLTLMSDGTNWFEIGRAAN